MKKFLKSKFNLENILEYGIYLLVFLLPLQTRLFLKEVYLKNVFWEYGSYSLYLIDVLIVVLFIISTIVIIKKKNFQIKKVWYFLALLEFFIFISIFFADVKYIAIYGYIKFLLALSVFFIISNSRYRQKYFTLSFLSGVFVQSLIAILQYIYNYSFPNKYLGMALHDPLALGTFVIELNDKTRILRSYAGFGHPNIFAFFSFIGIFIFIKYLLTLKNRKNISPKKQLLYFSILAIFFVGFLFTFSRSVFLLFLIYSIFLFLWSFFDKNRRAEIYKIVFSFLFIFLVFFVFNLASFSQRFSNNSRLENISNQNRIEQFSRSFKIIKSSLFTGVGMSSYSSELNREDFKTQEAWLYQPVHNVYLLVLAEVGIFGFLSFLALFAIFLYETIRQKLFFDSFLAFSLLFVFLFDHWLWSFHFGLIFMFFVLAIIRKNLQEYEEGLV